jgi:peptide deformylase
MAKLLQIAELGRPVLRKKAEVVQDITDPVIQDLIDDMLTTMKEIATFGLAAPQVHSAMRIFIMASEPTQYYPDAPRMEPIAVINPRIILKSQEMVEGWERCLSVPGMRGMVPRHKQIEVEYSTRDGKQVNATFHGMLTVIFQHEFDHLDGMVYLDRMVDMRNLVTEKEFQRIQNIT